MKLRTQIRDALKYTLKDWKTVILLGIILCATASFNDLDSDDLTVGFAMVIVALILLAFEEGYRYLIIKNTLKGDNNPPRVTNLKEILVEGSYEAITLIFYACVIYLLVEVINNINILGGMKDLQAAIISATCIFIYFLFFGAAINKVLHGGRFLSAFNAIEIIKYYIKIGLKRTLAIIIFGTISLNFIACSVFDYGSIDLVNTIDFLINFILSPIILLFITRLIALSGKEVSNDY